MAVFVFAVLLASLVVAAEECMAQRTKEREKE
jgi:hypothetical protein